MRMALKAYRWCVFGGREINVGRSMSRIMNPWTVP